MKKSLLLTVILFSSLLLSCDFSFGDTRIYEGNETWQTAAQLKVVYNNHFPMGNIIRGPTEVTHTRFNILRRHFSDFTAENHMKPDFIAPLSKPAGAVWTYRFADADTIVNAVNAAGMKMHGHTLVWHSQTPPWLTTGTDAEVLANLEKYVTEVTAHFKGRLATWDVANEVFRDGLTSDQANGDWRECLRNEGPNGSRWNQKIGPDYIEIAFLKARAADPDVKLYYNDYNLNNPNKARAVYNMVLDINTRHPNVGGRKLIDGIGMQSHHHINTSVQSVEDSINLFASLGVEVAITELDIMAAGQIGNNNVTWNDQAAQVQAKQYAALFKVFKKHSSKISRVTIWGLDDGTSWRASNRPTLLNSNYSLKPAFYAVLNP